MLGMVGTARADIYSEVVGKQCTISSTGQVGKYVVHDQQLWCSSGATATKPAKEVPASESKDTSPVSNSLNGGAGGADAVSCQDLKIINSSALTA